MSIDPRIWSENSYGEPTNRELDEEENGRTFKNGAVKNLVSLHKF